MSKESRFRRPFNKSHGKRVETLLKSERQHLYHIYWSIRRILRFKKSLWVIYKILGLFVNPLTADDKYCLLNRGNLMQHFKMQLSRKGKIFSEFFFFFFFFLNFINLYKIFKILKKILTTQLMYFTT